MCCPWVLVVGGMKGHSFSLSEYICVMHQEESGHYFLDYFSSGLHIFPPRSGRYRNWSEQSAGTALEMSQLNGGSLYMKGKGVMDLF